MPKTLTIKNIGPIKNISFEIKKINVFMGQQSSGKSTIAKILSYCSWIEKDVSLHQTYDNYVQSNNFFIEKLETFHKIKGYFNSKSFLEYTGDAIKITFSNSQIDIKWLDDRFYNYKRTKISYIPSERSVVILPEMEKVELPNNYLKSYLYDWFDTRKNFTSEQKLPILDTGVDYYYSEENKESHIGNKNFDILLSQASSGIQSVTPLLTMVHNLIINLYEQEEKSSYEFDEIKAKSSQKIIDQFLLEPYFNINFTYKNNELSSKSLSEKLKYRHKKVNDLMNEITSNEPQANKLFSNYINIRNSLFKTQRTNLIIEEPEQNLFPATQKQLCYKLFEYLNLSDYDHSLTLTTHSPYVLYAINNCILTFLTKEKIPELLKERISTLNSYIDPKNINIYEINEGSIKNIKQDNGLIGGNYFDQQMKEVMDDFYLLLNFLNQND
ncbi:hypothetical protein [Tenacibaculum singaporense]|uniref:AAA domain-containing protein n=1 Tax=Tenacibaculum singaporense TaxID=2358479 RepID=A0A3S8R4S4_9FLAO|nr:hypothetical protein [Tenacibaculum singaporense]AZJ34871.1 hypothetical protein D6T69_04760 [Tenacibaculum singaporense]